MNILKEVLSHEVMPSMGCTEPVAVALAAAHASRAVGGKVWRVVAELDPGTFKNGMNVFIPGTNGAVGIPIAMALGAICGDPKNGLNLLKNIDSKCLKEAEKLVAQHEISIKPNFSKDYLYIKVKVKTDKGEGIAKIVRGHTNLVELKKNGLRIKGTGAKTGCEVENYREFLRKLSIKDLIKAAENADKKELAYMKEGVEMNLKASKEGMKYKGFAHQISQMVKSGVLKNDFFSKTKVIVSAASDGRMAGMSLPVMSSGSSGNQGVVAVLVPYLFGKENGVANEKIMKSIALSHLLNAYVKAFAGELSPICQCAIAAGVGAAAACVYQRKNDMKLIGHAINNVANDLGGMFCNGANLGCAIKVASSAEAAITSALVALNGFCISDSNGIIGATPEETLQNLAKITCEGMGKTNEVILGIMKRQAEV